MIVEVDRQPVIGDRIYAIDIEVDDAGEETVRLTLADSGDLITLYGHAEKLYDSSAKAHEALGRIWLWLVGFSVIIAVNFLLDALRWAA